jgi:hypothetical protein
MSESESLRAALQIFAHQLVNVTYDGTGALPGVERFLTQFEAILDGISLVTKSSYPAAIKKTMLQTQLRGEPAVWCWESKEFRDLPYEDFKNALKTKFGKEKDKDDGKVLKTGL